MSDIIYKYLSYEVIGAAMEVHNKLGYGFLEKVYENALIILLEEKKINAKQQYPVSVYFMNKIVGDYYVDILVEDKIIIELKSCKKIADEHISQTLNYLKATNIKLGLILNFAKAKLEYKRLIL